jgi:hypothetical protein
VPLGARSNLPSASDPISSAIPSSSWRGTHSSGGISANSNLMIWVGKDSPPLPTGPASVQPIFSKCLALGHSVRDCLNQVRCRGCWNYGHIYCSCLVKNNRNRRIYRCIDKLITEPPEGSLRGNRPTYPSPASPNSNPLFLEDIDRELLAAEDMANYPCDPLPHLPPGADLIPLQCASPAAWVCHGRLKEVVDGEVGVIFRRYRRRRQ